MDRNYTEDFFQAIDQITQAKIDKLGFDQTFVCTVVDSSDADNGHYQVSDGSIIFDAYSENTNYSNNSQVYVLIPKGDWSQRKTITGRYSMEAGMITHLSGLEQMVILEKLETQNNSNYFVASKSYNTKLCNCLYISFNLKTEANVDIPKGFEFGIRAIVKNKNGEDLLLPPYTNKQMFGNPFYYLTPIQQEIVYPLGPELLETIQEVSIELIREDNGSIQNIVIDINNIQVYFGYSIKDVKNNTVIVLPETHSGVYYGTSIVKDIKETVQAIWINKDADGRYIGFNEKDESYALDIEKAKDKTKLELVDPNDDTKPGPDVGKNYYWIDWYRDLSYANLLLDESLSNNVLHETYNIALLPEFPETEVKAVVWLNGEKYESEIFTFKNERVKIDEVANLGVGLFIENANAQDLYTYDENNAMDNNITRTVKFTWTSANEIDDVFWLGATVTWKIPKAVSMLAPSSQFNSFDESNDNDFYIYTHIINNEDYDETNKLKELSCCFNYRLSSYYSEALFNNVIYCRIDVSDERGFVEARKNIAFDTFGLQGTDYSFVVAPTDRTFGFTSIDPLKEEEFSAYLLDPKGKEVDVEIIWNILSEGMEFVVEGAQVSGKKQKVKLKDPLKYNVLVAETSASWADNNIKLQREYPVSYSKDGKYLASAPSVIAYDSFGKLKTTSVPPLKLYEIKDNGELNEILCEWQIYNNDSLGNSSFNPSISSNLLQLSPFYIEGERSKNVLSAVIYSEHGYREVLWSRPLLIQQHKYSNDLLNNWDGKLKVDIDNNTILTNAIGAGKKHDDNTFSGVFLGEIRKYDETLKDYINPQTGLIGYGQGAQAFGFFDDGTAFIGKSDKGRIEFKGDKGIIKSANYEENKSGSQWDLDDGIFELNGTDGSYLRLKENKLDIKVDNFSLVSGSLGGINLLNQTAPYKGTNIDTTIWNMSEGGSDSLNIGGQDDKYQDTHLILNPQRTVLQEIILKPGKYYTISGYVNGRIVFKFSNRKVEGVWDDGRIRYAYEFGEVFRTQNFGNSEDNLVYFSETFRIPTAEELADKNDGDNIWAIILQNRIPLTGTTTPPEYNGELYSNPTILYHLKLEEGSIPSAWSSTNRDGQSNFNITNTKIEAKVSSIGGENGFGWKLQNDGFVLNSSNKEVFKCDQNGIYIDGEGNFTGVIHANSGGTIGGFEIGSHYIKTKDKKPEDDNFVGLYNSFNYADAPNTETGIAVIGGVPDGTWRLVVGKNFGVTSNGTLCALGAKIEGDVTITSGSITLKNTDTDTECSIGSNGKLFARGAELQQIEITDKSSNSTHKTIIRDGGNITICNKNDSESIGIEILGYNASIAFGEGGMIKGYDKDLLLYLSYEGHPIYPGKLRWKQIGSTNEYYLIGTFII